MKGGMDGIVGMERYLICAKPELRCGDFINSHINIFP